MRYVEAMARAINPAVCRSLTIQRGSNREPSWLNRLIMPMPHRFRSDAATY
jgi:hypothetical protein